MTERNKYEQPAAGEPTQENIKEHLEAAPADPEKQYQENVKEITKTAEDFVALKHAKKQLALQTPEAPTANTAAVLTLEAVQNERRQARRGLVESARDGLKKLGFKMRGVENPEQLAALIRYLESNIRKHHQQYKEVPKDQEEREIREYAAKGQRVEKTHYAKNEKGEEFASLIIEWETPYKFASRDAKKIARLLGQDNDPVALLEHLKQIGFQISAFDLAYRMDDLEALAKTPQLNQMLSKLMQAGVKGYYYLSHDTNGKKITEFLRELAGRDRSDGILAPERLAQIQRIAHALKTNLVLDKIEEYSAAMLGESDLKLLEQIGDDADEYKLSRAPAIRNLQMLKQAGLTDKILALWKFNINWENTPLKAMFAPSYQDDLSPEAAQKSVAELQRFLESPPIKWLHENPALAEFASRLSTIMGQELALDELDKYEKAQQYPETLAVFELMRQWRIDGLPYNWTNHFDQIEGLLKSRDLIGIIIRPEFRKFADDMIKQLGYRPSLYDIYLEGNDERELIALYKNTEARNRLLSPKGIELIKYTGEFSISELKKYEKLLAAPGMLSILQKLEQSFGYRYQAKGDWSTDDLIGLAQDTALQTALFSPAAIALFNSLREQLGYQFKLDQAKELAAAAADKEFRQKLFQDDNLQFIKKAADPSRLSDLRAATEIGQESRPLIVRLADGFGYRVSFYQGEQTDSEELRRLASDQTIQEKLFAPERIILFKEIQKQEYGRSFNLKEMDTLLALPLDFGKYLGEMRQRLGYFYNPKDLTRLTELKGREQKIYDLAAALKNADLRYAFKIGEARSWLELSQSDPDKTVEKISLLQAALTGYEFDISDECILRQLAEKDYNQADIEELKTIYQQYRSEYNQDQLTKDGFKCYGENLIILRENREAIIKTAQEMERMTGRQRNILDHTPKFRFIAQENLLPDIKELISLGDNTFSDTATLSPFGLEIIKKLRDDPDYRQVLDRFQILRNYGAPPININNWPWYKKLLNIPDLENNLKNTPIKIRQKIVGDNAELKIYLACRGDKNKWQTIDDLKNDSYFAKNKDAARIMTTFLRRFELAAYEDEIFTAAMSASKDPRNTKRLISRIMAVEQTNRALPQDERINLGFVKSGRPYQELFKEMNNVFSRQACQVLLQGENTNEQRKIREKLEGLLDSDEHFEDDFEIMTKSIGIYVEKYPRRDAEPDKSCFNETIRAIRQALELDITRDANDYHLKRIKESQEQFDRLFSQFPEAPRQAIERLWTDISKTLKSSLDQTTVSEKQALENKLQEIRTTFASEILPDLTILFKKKAAGLEEQASKEEKDGKPGIYSARREMFDKYLLDEKGEVRSDIVKMYREISKDLRDQKQQLRQPIAPQEKSRISKNLGALRQIKDTLRGIYKLGAIRPEKINKKTDYAAGINKIADLVGNNLHKLAIVDKAKKPGNEPEDALETDLRDHLQHLSQVIAEEDHPRRLWIESKFVTDFNSLARCPELTNSCQRLTELTEHNETAYSRILDGVNQLVDVWETAPTKQRLARCFTELSSVQLPEEKPRPVVLFDRVYTRPDYTAFNQQLTATIIKTGIQRFKEQPEISLMFGASHFEPCRDLIEAEAKRAGYRLREITGANYLIQESRLKLPRGKYYDSLGGAKDTTKSHYEPTDKFYFLERP